MLSLENHTRLCFVFRSRNYTALLILESLLARPWMISTSLHMMISGIS